MRANCLFKLMEARLCVKHFAMFSTVSFFFGFCVSVTASGQKVEEKLE